MTYSFNVDLEYSINGKDKTDCGLIKSAIPNCIKVYKTDKETDKKGIDYIAELDRGAEINIDAKRRRNVQFVNGYPELALEIWSVMPDKGNKGKAGWTCSRETSVDMILYVFDNWDKFYLVPFQLLRAAFQKNAKDNWAVKYRISTQNNETWRSKCMFVPADVVLQAVSDEMIHTIN